MAVAPSLALRMRLVRMRFRLQAQLRLGVAVLVDLPLEVGQQIKHRASLLIAEMVIESCPWLGILDIHDDLGVIPNGLSSATQASVSVGLLALLRFWLLRHWTISTISLAGLIDAAGDQSRTSDGLQANADVGHTRLGGRSRSRPANESVLYGHGEVTVRSESLPRYLKNPAQEAVA
jgi:hypothetical protein